MFLCILDLAACRLAGDHIVTVAGFWSEILTEICVWYLTSLLSLHAFAWSKDIVFAEQFLVKSGLSIDGRYTAHSTNRPIDLTFFLTHIANSFGEKIFGRYIFDIYIQM